MAADSFGHMQSLGTAGSSPPHNFAPPRRLLPPLATVPSPPSLFAAAPAMPPSPSPPSVPPVPPLQPPPSSAPPPYPPDEAPLPSPALAPPWSHLLEVAATPRALQVPEPAVGAQPGCNGRRGITGP